MTKHLWTLDAVRKLDQEDPMKHFKKEFYLKESSYYMDGNSLGLLSKRAEQSLFTSLEDWKTSGIDGWTEAKEPWFYLSEKLGDETAPLIGAKPHQVINTGSITTNLHQLLATFYNPAGKRTKILADTLNFPSDIYALKSQIKLRDLDPAQELVQIQSKDGYTLEETHIINQMGEDIALLLLPSVLYRSGQLLDIKGLQKQRTNMASSSVSTWLIPSALFRTPLMNGESILPFGVRINT